MNYIKYLKELFEEIVLSNDCGSCGLPDYACLCKKCNYCVNYNEENEFCDLFNLDLTNKIDDEFVRLATDCNAYQKED